MGRITIDVEVMQGKPVIRGRPITVDPLLRKLSRGAQAEQSDVHPRLGAEDIRDALAHKADRVSDEAPPR